MLRKKRYDYFKYSLPTQPSSHYARAAIKILAELKKSFPEFYEILSQSSEVLTLSGVRAFDTYYSLGKDVKPERIVELQNLLRSHDILLLEETYPIIGEKNLEHNYSLVNISALRRISEDYGYVPGWKMPVIEHLHTNNDFTLFWFLWKNGIANDANEENRLPKVWRTNWWAIHDITFGMLLGYPGEAICSAVYEEDITSMLQAEIAYGQTEEGAWPIYYYHKDVKDHPNIHAHEKLWSDILTSVREAGYLAKS